MRIAIFLGPTLSHDEAKSILAAEFFPPAGQGDVYRLIRDVRPQVIGIVDGYFQQVAAVWHREILYALNEGVHVFGAASMGALRAVELHAYGMRGVGAVFQAYRDGVYPPYAPPFERDEEVAVEHGPPETGYLALSDALVDMRATFSMAENAGLLTPSARDSLLGVAAGIHFADRNYHAVFNAPATAQIEGMDLAALERWVSSNKVTQKADDARAMLAEIGRFAASEVKPFQSQFRFEPALVWERFRAACDRSDDGRVNELEERILDELRLDPIAFATLADEARLHTVAARVTVERADLTANAERSGLDVLRARHNLARRVDIEAWMSANAVDLATMRRLAVREAAIGAHERAPNRALLDHLRAAGLVAPLYARAVDKERTLSDAPERRRTASNLEKAALTAWWFEDHGGGGGAADLSQQAKSLGLDGEDALLEMLWRERLYLRRRGMDAGSQ